MLAKNETAFACRACGRSDSHETILSLGSLPLGNGLLTREQLAKPEERFAIDFAVCEDCSLLQVREGLPSDKLGTEIHYFTSVSPTILAHGQRVAKLVGSLLTTKAPLVVEIGSNDGSLLAAVREGGSSVIGIEPIGASAELARRERGIETVAELFSADLARRLVDGGQRADVIIANYVLELVPYLPDFIEGLRILLAPNGTAIIEVPYVRSMAEQLRFDALAHLRASWFSATSFDHLLRRNGVRLYDAEYLTGFRGGTLRVYATHSEDAKVTARATDLLDAERADGLTSVSYYREFGVKVHKARDQLVLFLLSEKAAGKRIAAYGAGIKAAALLNFANLDPSVIDFTVDCNPAKQGRYMPGSHIPVLPTEALTREMPDLALLLALDFTDEVLEQQSDYRSRGGRFILPLPQPLIV